MPISLRKTIPLAALLLNVACVVVPADPESYDYAPPPPPPPPATIYEYRHYDHGWRDGREYREDRYHHPRYERDWRGGRRDYERRNERRHEDHGYRDRDRGHDRDHNANRDREYAPPPPPPPTPSAESLKPLQGNAVSGKLRDFLREQGKKNKQNSTE